MSLQNSASRAANIEAGDLLIEIFLYLPFRSVTRFKSVCKQWHSLATDPEFRKTWFNLRNRTLKPSSTGLLVSCYNFESERTLSSFIPFSSNNSTIPSVKPELTIVTSCNGLLLCYTGSTYLVYNPTTTVSSTLPKLLVAKRMLIRSMSFAFDPRKSPYYKVVCCTSFYSESGNKLTYFHVYSSDTCIWTSVDKAFEPVTWVDAGVYWNGSIHWIHASKYFNIENQKLNIMPALPHSALDSNVYYFGENCDRLNYSSFNKYCSSFIDIYELKRDYSEWLLKYQVDVDLGYKYNVTSIISVVHGEDEDDSFLVLRVVNRIVRYNLVSKISKVLRVLMPGRVREINRAFQYIESYA